MEKEIIVLKNQLALRKKRKLTPEQRQEVLRLLDDGQTNAMAVAIKLGLAQHQVAAVKAWRTMGKFPRVFRVR